MKKGTKKVKVDKPHIKGTIEILDTDEALEANGIEIMHKVADFPLLNTKYWFSADDKESFIGEIKSFDPLKVVAWSIVGGCQHDEEVPMESLDEWDIMPADKAEIFRRLA